MPFEIGWGECSMHQRVCRCVECGGTCCLHRHGRTASLIVALLRAVPYQGDVGSACPPYQDDSYDNAAAAEVVQGPNFLEEDQFGCWFADAVVVADVADKLVEAVNAQDRLRDVGCRG